MRKKIKNEEHIFGRLYEHSLVKKVVEREDSPNKGTEYISGTIAVATDENILNIIEVHYTYVAPVYKSGKTNVTFTTLSKIINEGKTVLTDGKENATLLQLDPAFALNEFYSDKNGQEQLICAKRNEGGFVSFVKELPQNEAARATFEMDVFITGCKRVEKEGEEDYLVLTAYTFNFRQAILPIDLTVRSKAAMDYFEGLELSQKNPVFTKVKGRLTSQNIVTRIEEPSAFGEPSIKEYTKTLKEWVVTWAQEVPYELGDAENGITSDDVKQAMADRELHLADVKKRQDEYQAHKGKIVAATATLSAAEGGFDF